MLTAKKLIPVVLAILTLLSMHSSAHAVWPFNGYVQGVPTYRDPNTGKIWTVTLGKVASNNNGQQAAAHDSVDAGQRM